MLRLVKERPKNDTGALRKSKEILRGKRGDGGGVRSAELTLRLRLRFFVPKVFSMEVG